MYVTKTCLSKTDPLSSNLVYVTVPLSGIRQTDISTFTVPKITGVGGGSGEFNTKKKD